MAQDVLELVDEYADSGAEILLLEPRDHYDKCLVGIGERFNSSFAVYDRQCILDVIAEDLDGNEEDALEYFDFNVRGGWVGEATPCFVIKPA